MTALDATVTSAGQHRWWQALTLALAAGYLMIGVLSPTPSIRWPFVIGAVLVAAGLAVLPRSRPAAWTAVVLGALAPVPTTWWSVATPVTALLILGCATAAIRSSTSTAPALLPKDR
jgi:hypothetical protein